MNKKEYLNRSFDVKGIVINAIKLGFLMLNAKIFRSPDENALK